MQDSDDTADYLLLYPFPSELASPASVSASHQSFLCCICARNILLISSDTAQLGFDGTAGRSFLLLPPGWNKTGPSVPIDNHPVAEN
jgi:hypothetical protein